MKFVITSILLALTACQPAYAEESTGMIYILPSSEWQMGCKYVNDQMVICPASVREEMIARQPAADRIDDEIEWGLKFAELYPRNCRKPTMDDILECPR